MTGLATGSAERSRIVPREVGCRLQALTVMAGKRCRGSPNLSSDSGWTWNSMFARSWSGEDVVKMPSCEGAMVERALLEQGIFGAHQGAADQRMIGLVERLDAVDLEDRALLKMVLQVAADARLVVHHGDAELGRASRPDRRRRAAGSAASRRNRPTG